MAEFLFRPYLTKTDVTAIKLLPKYILAGVGGFLHIFDKETKKLKSKVEVFEENKIHGILLTSNNSKILVYGGKEVQIISTNESFTKFNIISTKTLHDWILAAKWVYGDQKVATVSMHNKITIWSENFETDCEVECEEKCILYSAYICYDTFEELVILSGTVFSEVLLWMPGRCGDNNLAVVLKRLKKHNGVIFSIDYSEEEGFICSTSDDRSAVLWAVKNKSLLLELQQKEIDITEKCQVYGHQARIFRCKIIQNTFITAGEDSLVNLWNFNGELQRKIESNGGTIWALDFSKDADDILVGRADCSVSALKINCPISEEKLLLPHAENPKYIGILNSANLVVISEQANLYYLKKSFQSIQKIKHHEDLQSYVLLQVSPCRKMVVLAGIKGQMYIYKEDFNGLHLKYFYILPEQSRIFALHWLDCKSFLVCQNEGKLHLFLLDNEIRLANTFSLPPSRERWSTCACLTLNRSIVVGDRMGNIHLFNLVNKEPLKTFKKAHDHLGVSSLYCIGNFVTSLGRNGIIKQYQTFMGLMECKSSDKTPFSWLANVIDFKYLLAFSGHRFLVCDYLSKRVLFEKVCGGGHRSWDFYHQPNETNFVYLKDKAIHIVEFNLQDFIATDYLEGYHVKNINALKVIKCEDEFILISGGEDTTLKVNIMKDNNIFKYVTSLKSHLSSIRALEIHKLTNEFDGEYLIFSAGGRAQVICWRLSTIRDDILYGCLSEVHSYYEEIDQQESEMRIMALSTVNYDKEIFLFCGCSDGNIKIFLVENNGTSEDALVLFKNIFYQLSCITKLVTFYLNDYFLLVTMATDGKIVFWDISDFTNRNVRFEPLNSFQTHQSGINSFSFKVIDCENMLFLTGGDDNEIKVTLFRYTQKKGRIHIVRIDTFSDTGTHCAQITGAFLYEQYFFTSSVDQKVAVFRYEHVNDVLHCELVQKYKTNVEDLQGLECIVDEGDKFNVFIYGNGLEYIQVSKLARSQNPNNKQ